VAMPRMSRHGLRWRIRRGRIASLAQGQERSTWAAADGKTSMRYAYGAIGVVAVSRNRLRRVLGYCDRQRSDKVQGTSIEAVSNLTR
jgi:hypothetical protein